MKKLFSVLVLGLVGCDMPPLPPEIPLNQVQSNAPAATAPVSATNRVTITLLGTVNDGLAYSGKRGVYLIIDRRTDKEFIGVSGIGISELGSHQDNHNNQNDER